MGISNLVNNIRMAGLQKQASAVASMSPRERLLFRMAANDNARWGDLLLKRAAEGSEEDSGDEMSYAPGLGTLTGAGAGAAAGIGHSLYNRAMDGGIKTTLGSDWADIKNIGKSIPGLARRLDMSYVPGEPGAVSSAAGKTLAKLLRASDRLKAGYRAATEGGIGNALRHPITAGSRGLAAAKTPSGVAEHATDVVTEGLQRSGAHVKHLGKSLSSAARGLGRNQLVRDIGRTGLYAAGGAAAGYAGDLLRNYLARKG